MILYKYVSHEAGMKIIENNSVGFSRPSNFNDPFELEAAYPSENCINNQIESLFYGIQIEGKKHTWKQNTGILSLTRQPLNSLMWSHYGVKHTGMVIGIDVSIPEFTCQKTNIVPVQYGNVIYTDQKPDNTFLCKPTEALSVGSTFHFSCDHLERLQRLFLFKPMCWSYEEEVRVVKCIKGIEDSKAIESGSFNEIRVSDVPLYLLKIPNDAIKEVYVGAHSNIIKNKHTAATFFSKVTAYQPNSNIYGCEISKSSWNLERFDLGKAIK